MPNHPAHDITLLNIEFNSSCNLRCKWCALDHRKTRQIMSKETLTRVMEDLAANQLPNIRRVDLHNGGETLLHPDLAGMLTVIRRYKAKLPVSPIFALLTNGMLLSPKISEQIVRSRAVDQLRFSLDGTSPEEFETIRKGAKWDLVAKNILHFLAMNTQAGNPIRTEAICMLPTDVTMDSQGVPQLSDQTAALFAKFNKVSLRHPHNWDGSAELGVDDSSYQAIAEERIGEVCFLLKNNLVVLPTGDVTVCCNDLNARGVIGSVHHSSLAELAVHPTRLSMVEAFALGRKAELALCADCTGFYTPPK